MEESWWWGRAFVFFQGSWCKTGVKRMPSKHKHTLRRLHAPIRPCSLRQSTSFLGQVSKKGFYGWVGDGKHIHALNVGQQKSTWVV